MATVLIAGLFGLVGTVLGTVLTTWTGRQAAERSHREALVETQRKEYRSAVIRFSSALLACRVAEMDRWHARNGSEEGERAARRNTHETRAAMWDACYELELSSNSQTLNELARDIANKVYGIHDAETLDGMNGRSYQVRNDLFKMIAMARVEMPGRPEFQDLTS